MNQAQNLPHYDWLKSYRWNYDHVPEPVDLDLPDVPGEWTFCGLPVDSPLGMPAGPLLNGAWILYYASLGFDVLTYKTVRSIERECYDLPNLQPVQTGQLHGGESEIPAIGDMHGSWAVSFGMPSMSVDVWRKDVEETRNALPKGKLLSVSVVASVQPDWSLDDLADDYAQCAKWAVESGADAVETNFSCPNVSTCDGQLYQQSESAGIVAARVREVIGSDVPYLIKVGHVPHEEDAVALLKAVGPHVNGLAMTNSVAATVKGADGSLLFNGQPRGICGAATLDASVGQMQMFARLKTDMKLDLSLVGVGGAGSAADVCRYLEAGGEAVHIATAAMVDPGVAMQIRRDLPKLLAKSIPAAGRA